jgi:hypothetical protein
MMTFDQLYALILFELFLYQLQNVQFLKIIKIVCFKSKILVLKIHTLYSYLTFISLLISVINDLNLESIFFTLILKEMSI